MSRTALLLALLSAPLLAGAAGNATNGTFIKPSGAPGNVTLGADGKNYYVCDWSFGGASERRGQCGKMAGHTRTECYKVPELVTDEMKANSKALYGKETPAFCACGPVRAERNRAQAPQFRFRGPDPPPTPIMYSKGGHRRDALSPPHLASTPFFALV